MFVQFKTLDQNLAWIIYLSLCCQNKRCCTKIMWYFSIFFLPQINSYPLYFCLSHRLTIMHWYLYPIPVVPAYCSLFLFLFFTAIGDFHTADSWKASCEWISKPEKSTWPISDWYFTSARSGLEMWYSDWFRKGSFITFEMVQMGRNQKN